PPRDVRAIGLRCGRVSCPWWARSGWDREPTEGKRFAATVRRHESRRLGLTAITRLRPRVFPVVALSALVSVTVMCRTAAATSVSFTTQGEHTFTVPSGVTSLTNVIAIGGAGGGGGGGAGGTGGHGAKVTMPTLTMIPGETLYVEVGANGRHG